MTSADSIFVSVLSEQRWIQEMRNTFQPDHIVDIDGSGFGPRVYRAPKPLSDTKPEAYSPHSLALGPFHHLRPNLYKTQNQKLAAIRKFLMPERLQNFHLLIKRLKELEPLLRSCYDEYIDLDVETLAWILAIDGLYLLYYSSCCADDDPDTSLFVQDVFMMENQIPAFVLKEIRHVLRLPPHDDLDDELDDENAYTFLFQDLFLLCEKHSPLKLNEVYTLDFDAIRSSHLLHYTYDSIVSNRGEKRKPAFAMYSLITDVQDIVNVAADLGVPGAGILQKHFKFMESVPWDRISSLFKKGDPDEHTPLVEEIKIPSVSQLNETAGVTFVLTPGGIRDIEFVDEEKKFYLPVIRLDSNSEVILRNLVAYEAASAKPGSPRELGQYLDLMCGIIDSPKDVTILREAGIIIVENDILKDDEIARFFNGIQKSSDEKTEKISNVEQAIERVNKRYDDVGCVKWSRFMKRYVYASWKCLTLLSAIILILLLVLQAFCSIYGCSKHWFGA